MMRTKNQKEWSRAVAIKPKDNLTTEIGYRAQKFVPSYEQECCPESMALIMANQYARIWLAERDEFIVKREKAVKPKFIKNDFEWWLQLHKTTKRFCRLK